MRRAEEQFKLLQMTSRITFDRDQRPVSSGNSNGGAEYLDEHERGVKEVCHFVRQELEH